VVLTVFAAGESIDPFNDVLAAQMRVRSGNPLAFDDCMRVMFLLAQKDFEEHQRNIGTPIR
jgi:hypothetical protein